MTSSAKTLLHARIQILLELAIPCNIAEICKLVLKFGGFCSYLCEVQEHRRVFVIHIMYDVFALVYYYRSDIHVQTGPPQDIETVRSVFND